MTLEEVVKSGKELYIANRPLNVAIDGMFLGFFIFNAIIAVIFLVGWLIKSIRNKNKRGVLFSILVIVVDISLIYALAVAYTKHEEYYKETVQEWNEMYEEWKEDIAYPYIRTQELTKQEIRELQLEPTSHKNTDQEGITLTLVLIDPETKKLTTETDNYQVEMTLNSGDQPYLTYYTLTEDIALTIKRGKYLKTVYLPKDYQFTK